MYKWAHPKICGEDLEGAVTLPASGTKTRCPPCNPGFFKTNHSACEPCPYGSYSNGSGNPFPACDLRLIRPHVTHGCGLRGRAGWSAALLREAVRARQSKD